MTEQEIVLKWMALLHNLQVAAEDANELAHHAEDLTEMLEAIQGIQQLRRQLEKAEFQLRNRMVLEMKAQKLDKFQNATIQPVRVKKSVPIDGLPDWTKKTVWKLDARKAAHLTGWKLGAFSKLKDDGVIIESQKPIPSQVAEVDPGKVEWNIRINRK